MQTGMIKVFTAMPFIEPMSIEENANKVMNLIDEAVSQNAAIAVLQANTLTGAGIGDYMLDDAIYNDVKAAILSITSRSEGLDILIALESHVRYQGRTFNAIFFIQDGEILSIKLQKRKRVARHEVMAFGDDMDNYIEYAGEPIEVGDGVFSTEDFSFKISHLSDVELDHDNTNLLIAIDDSPWGASRDLKLVKKAAGIFEFSNADVIIVEPNSYQSGGEKIFSGAIVHASDERIDFISEMNMRKLPYGAAHIIYVDIAKAKGRTAGYGCIAVNEDVCELEDVGEVSSIEDCKIESQPFINDVFYSKQLLKPLLYGSFEEKEDLISAGSKESISLSYNIISKQAMALAGRAKRIGLKKFVVGFSGGLDSTLVLFVAKQALQYMGGSMDDLIAVMMPGLGNSEKIQTNAEIILKELGIKHRNISIKEAVISHFKDIGHAPDVYDRTYENAQARERTQILMDIANMEGAIMPGSGDMSEIALGWSTYGGDHMAMYDVNAGLPKTVIKRMIADIAACDLVSEKLKEALVNVLNAPISPELLPLDSKGEVSQNTEESIGSYELHDFFLYYKLRYIMEDRLILQRAKSAFYKKYDEDYIEKTFSIFNKRFKSQEFKRKGAPEGLSLCDVSFFDMPSDMK